MHNTTNSLGIIVPTSLMSAARWVPGSKYSGRLQKDFRQLILFHRWQMPSRYPQPFPLPRNCFTQWRQVCSTRRAILILRTKNGFVPRRICVTTGVTRSTAGVSVTELEPLVGTGRPGLATPGTSYKLRYWAQDCFNSWVTVSWISNFLWHLFYRLTFCPIAYNIFVPDSLLRWSGVLLWLYCIGWE